MRATGIGANGRSNINLWKCPSKDSNQSSVFNIGWELFGMNLMGVKIERR